MMPRNRKRHLCFASGNVDMVEKRHEVRIRLGIEHYEARIDRDPIGGFAHDNGIRMPA
jgi:hypothetical protein